jgi:hypothetical protein
VQETWLGIEFCMGFMCFEERRRHLKAQEAWPMRVHEGCNAVPKVLLQQGLQEPKAKAPTGSKPNKVNSCHGCYTH